MFYLVDLYELAEGAAKSQLFEANACFAELFSTLKICSQTQVSPPEGVLGTQLLGWDYWGQCGSRQID